MTATIESGMLRRPEFEVVNVVNEQNDALRVYQSSRRSIEASIYREDDAVDVALGAIALKSVAGFAGPPGGGKTTLMEAAVELIEPSGPNVWISGGAEMTPNQMTGGKMESEKQIISADESVETVRQMNMIKGMIMKEAASISVDEATRLAPRVFNALLSAMENKRVESTAGVQELHNLIVVMLAYNPGEAKQATSPLSYAAASRIAFGAIMGLKGDKEDRKDYTRGVRKIEYDHVARGIEKPGDAIGRTMTRNGVDTLGKYLLNTAISDETMDKIDDIALGISDYLADHKIIETDRRIAKQMEKNARAFVMRNDKREVTEKDIHDATRSVIVGRLGSRATFHQKDQLETDIKSLTSL